MHSARKAILIAVLSLFAYGASGPGLAQESAGGINQDIESTLEQELFGDVEAARVEAEQVEAGLLSPRTFRQATDYRNDARNDLAKGRDLERVQKNAARAVAAFRQATENVQLARLALSDAIESRSAAKVAAAPRLAASDWAKAEKLFNAAAVALERGSLDGADKRQAEAGAQYRRAELEAIRTRVLSESWRMIAEAESAKADKFAPQTFRRARQFAQRADDLIATDRYALDEPLALAERAEYEARHAAHIAGLVRQIDDEERSVESLILEWESAFAEVADAAAIDPDFSAGPRESGTRIIALLEELPGLRSDLRDRDALIIGLEDEIRELDAALGGASADRSRLIRRLEQQARVREQFRQIEDMFTPDEAVVLRDGNNLIVRLIGLSFAPNAAELDTDAPPLLTKVQSAIGVFPQCELRIEGHTDAQGNADRNLALSERRAQAVKTYMTDVMRIPGFRIAATGFGDTRPIANNKTAEGRTRNRRIDLIIIPKAESL